MPGSDELEHDLLVAVDETIRTSTTLLRWWEQKNASITFAEHFPLIRTFNPPVTSYGMFDRVPLNDAGVPVMGLYQEMVYDQGKETPPASINRQLREFVLRYFLRVADVCRPEAFADGPRIRNAALDRISWCPEKEVTRAGFGFTQLYYKRADSGEIGRFPERAENQIVDLREIGPVYDWILLRVDIFDFTLTFRPFGAGRPRVVVPVKASNYLLVTRDFIVDNPVGDDETLARYGLGYAVLRTPTPEGLLAYGPGHFDYGFQTFDFGLLPDGSIHVSMAFVVNRPVRIVNVPTDPLDWMWLLTDVATLGVASQWLPQIQEFLDNRGARLPTVDALSWFITLVNVFSGGAAGRALCISRKHLEKDFLVYHFKQHYDMVVGSLSTWSSVRDWTVESALPLWIRTGMSDVAIAG